MLSELLRAFVPALLVSLLLCAAMLPLARRWNLVSGQRAARAGPGGVPLLGGAGVLGGVAAGLLIAGPAWAARSGTPPVLLSGAWLLAVAFGLLGLADDRLGLPPIARLVTEGACALVGLAWIALEVARFYEGQMRWDLVLLGSALIVAAANAFNLADNSDGTAAGAGTLTFLGITALLLPIALRPAILSVHPLPDLLGPLPAAGAGALLGVLFWNRPPARIYLGDMGSLASGALLGVVLFWIALFLLPPGALTVPWPGLCLVLILGYLIFDPLYAALGRLLDGRRPWVGGTDHPSHHLRRWLGSDRRVWAAILLVQAVSVTVGVAVARGWLAPPAYLVALLAWTLLLLAALRGARVRAGAGAA